MEHTRVCDTDADVAADEGLLVQLKSLLQVIDGSELGIAESLGTHLLAVLDDANVDDAAASASEELGNGLLVGIVGEVAQVGGVGGFIGEGELLALLTRIA